MRLLFLPNESGLGDQVGPRKAFEHLLEQGVLSSYTTYSFLYESKRRGSDNETITDLIKRASDFCPDIIFWQHVQSFAVSKRQLGDLLAIKSKPKLVYHEGDIYGSIKRLTPSMVSLASMSDLVFLAGLGSNAGLFRKAGANKIRFSPSFADLERFGKPWDFPKEREFDVVMIGNRGHPIRKIPGQRNRERAVKELTRHFGDRFRVYGKGWNGCKSAAGPLPYDQQEQVIRRSWISIGWNKFDKVPLFFSDRLPIALLSGVAHVTNYIPGYDAIFDNGRHLFYAHSVGEAVAMIDYLLRLPKRKLIEIGMNGQKFALENLTADKVFSNIANDLCSLLGDRKSRSDE